MRSINVVHHPGDLPQHLTTLLRHFADDLHTREVYTICRIIVDCGFMIQAWLNVMCQVLPRVRAAAVIYANTQGTEEAPLLAVWPPGTEPARALRQMVPRDDRQPTVMTDKSASNKQLLRIAKLVSVSGDNKKTLVVELEADVAQKSVILQLLEWGDLWLELLNSGAPPSQDVHVEALGEVLHATDLNAALTAAATRLAQAYQLDRVFIARGQPGSLKVCAISHNVRFDGRSNLIKQVECALEESLCAQSAASNPDPVQPAIAEVKASQDMGELIALPLAGNDDRAAAAMLIENDSSAAFTDQQLTAFNSFSNLMGPAIHLREKAEQPAMSRLFRDVRGFFEIIVGPQFLPLKIALAGLFLMIFVLAVFDGDYEVVAPATLEGRTQRSIVAPFAGYVKEQKAKAGDHVTKGQVVAELDARELELERKRLLSVRGKLEKQYNQALAVLDQVEVKIYASQLAQVDVQLDLVRVQTTRTQLTAPMSGIIIRGDLSRSLGAAVERGDVLFEIAPLDDYRLVIDVPESRIIALEPGQSGYLVLKAFPDRKTEFQIEQISGAIEQRDGLITFSVIAAITDDDIDKLRPGMSGVARINAGERSMLWIQSHEMVDWIRLALWRLSP